MGKISRYLVLAVIAGVAIVGFWVYQKYFKASGSSQVLVSVERGDLEELVRVQGEVAPTNEYDLEFSTAGIVSNTYVKEGDEVPSGAPLMKLDSSELVLEKERLSAQMAQRSADLAKLTEGATSADLAVYEAKVTSATASVQEAEKAERLALRAVFTAMDDAVRNTTDLFYSGVGSMSPKLSFATSDSQLAISLEAERLALTGVLNADATAASTTSSDGLHATALRIQTDAQRVGTFLDNNAKALNSAVPGSTSATNIQSWQSAVAAARSALNANATALSASEESYSAASAALTVAQKELALKKSPARAEDISAAQAAVSEVLSQIKIVEDKIRKSTLVAPEKSRVVHMAYKAGEAARQGSPAVILNGLLPQVESDVSELDIARVHTGASAHISLDALPGTTFEGTVVVIDPQKVEKDGDTYYRVNFSLASSSAAVRPGMTAEVLVRVSEKKNVLKIPAYATFERDGKPYARVMRDGVETEVPVVLGISDGEKREVVSGLSEGEQVVIPTD